MLNNALVFVFPNVIVAGLWLCSAPQLHRFVLHQPVAVLVGFVSLSVPILTAVIARRRYTRLLALFDEWQGRPTRRRQPSEVSQAMVASN